MSAAYQNSASGKANAATSITLTAFDCGSGSNRALATCLQFADGSSNQPNPTSIAVAYNGVALSAITGASGVSAGSWDYQIWYYLPSQPTSTPSDIVASWSNSNDVVIAAIAANGVDQTNFVGNGIASSGTSTSPAVTVTGSSGNLSVGSVTGGSGRTLSAATQTERWNQNPSELCAAGSTANGGTVTHQWTQSVSDIWASAGFEFLAIPATAALTGTATGSITEADIVSGGKTIILTLSNDTFVAASAGNIQFVGGATASKVGATSGNSTIALSSGLSGGIASAVSAGDLVIAVYGTGSTADRTLAITDGASNYTLIGSEQFQTDTFATNLRVAYKFMGGTPDSSTTFGPTGNAADAGAMAVYVFRGVDSGTPLDVAAVQASAGDTSRVVPPDITPSTAGAYPVVIGAAAHNGGVDTFTSGDLTDFQTVGGNDTNDVTIGIGHQPDWSSGATNFATWGHSQADSTSFSWAATTIALRPVVTTPFADARDDLRDGLDSAQSEASGWDAKVKPNIPVANVVRTSDTVCTITLQAQADYDITAQETITATIPATILSGGVAIVASPTFTVDTSGGGGASTLTAAKGSFTLTGVAASLKAARKLTATKQTYTLTGVAAGLKAGRKIAPAKGTFTLTGVAVGLKAGRKIAPAKGTFTLSGIATGLKAARKIAPAVGTFGLTGNAATLTYQPAAGAFILVAVTAPFVLTGSDVTFTYTRAVSTTQPQPSGGWFMRPAKRKDEEEEPQEVAKDEETLVELAPPPTAPIASHSVTNPAPFTYNQSQLGEISRDAVVAARAEVKAELKKKKKRRDEEILLLM